MHSNIERPYPVEYLHPNGDKAKIGFIWGDPDSTSPVGIIIWIKDENGYAKLGEEVGEWPTFGDAMRRGTDLAFRWLSR
ncbi:hypothetical protein [Pseudomonas fluorescens]|uniref:Uncharacterized protein n=1 Tax=Pseudomonas fluorescens TaxID=294 RepID=A0A5E7FAX8_PSEFL|nr:hypothetical protein [Pseudomonas fluorescens]VVO36114.1 hypothetical protein PS723_05385 [Pseudomonas fluorescens]